VSESLDGRVLAVEKIMGCVRTSGPDYLLAVMSLASLAADAKEKDRLLGILKRLVTAEGACADCGRGVGDEEAVAVAQRPHDS
jgi:hypothetical protein